jgi:hypothetical protein
LAAWTLDGTKGIESTTRTFIANINLDRPGERNRYGLVVHSLTASDRFAAQLTVKHRAKAGRAQIPDWAARGAGQSLGMAFSPNWERRQRKMAVPPGKSIERSHQAPSHLRS